MVDMFAHHDHDSCKGCRKIGDSAPHNTVMDGNEHVRQRCCVAASDGYLETPYGLSIALGCSESSELGSTMCFVHTAS